MTKLTVDLDVPDRLAARLTTLSQETVKQAANEAATVAFAALADKTDRDDDTVFAALAVALALSDKEAALRLSADNAEKTALALFALLEKQNDAAQDALAAASDATIDAFNVLRAAQEQQERQDKANTGGQTANESGGAVGSDRE